MFYAAGIARLCCDSRRQVRSQALTYLQRALLVHDLQTLSAVEWEACFNKVSCMKYFCRNHGDQRFFKLKSLHMT